MDPMKPLDKHFYLDALIRFPSIYVSGDMVSVQVLLQEAVFLRKERQNLGKGFCDPPHINKGKTMRSYDEQHRRNMDLSKQAEKEYLDFIGLEEPDEEVADQKLCFGGLKHQFIGIDWEWTCNECGLVSGPTPHVSEYGCWDRAGVEGPDKSSVSFKFVSFCQRKNITAYALLGGRVYEVVKSIRRICEAEEPRGKRLPNLNILTFQVCRRLNIKIDESLLRIPKGKIPHDRCKRIFETFVYLTLFEVGSMSNNFNVPSSIKIEVVILG